MWQQGIALLEATAEAHAHRILSHARSDQETGDGRAAWRRPDVDSALQYVNARHPRSPDGKPYGIFGPQAATTGRYCFEGGCGEQCDLWDEGYVSDLAIFGSGITNYFKWIKWTMWVFAVLALLNAPALVINSIGEGFTVLSGIESVAQTTIGNLGSQQNVTTEVPICKQLMELNGISCEIEKDRLGTFYEVVDVIGAIFFIAAWAWLRQFHQNEVAFIDRYTLKVSDFSVYIPNLPPTATADEIDEHFSNTLMLDVKDVSVAVDQRQLFSAFKRRGRKIIQRHRLTEQLKFLYSSAARRDAYCCVPPEKRIQRIQQERQRLKAEIRALNVALARRRDATSAVAAYVTFDRQEDRDRALAMYQQPLWKRLLGFCGCYPSELYLRTKRTGERHTVKVMPAPDASTILWENQVRFRARALIRGAFLS